MITQKLKSVLASVAVSALFAGPLWAGDNPVVVELYTSQGCSSCPPADAILHDLAKRDDVIALAFHVDYWDYIGWKDEFADPAHTGRQRTYARIAGRRSIYTPEMIIGGQDSVVGARAMDIVDSIQKQARHESGVSVDLARVGESIQISAQSSKATKPMTVQLLRFQAKRDVRITRGENAGKNISYANVVQDWQVLGEWSGKNALDLKVKAPGDMPVVVLLQTKGQGRILAAAQLR